MTIDRYPFNSTCPEIMDMLIVEFEEEEYRLQQFLKESNNGKEQKNKNNNKN